MTGLHAFHMIIGIGLVLWIMIAGLMGAFTPRISLRWKTWAYIGTSSIWCGFIFFRCSI